jgi:abequosyltransferase
MEREQPILTIAIPTYNRRKYLEELLICLKPQLADQQKVELLISNNASPDDTEEMVQSLQKQGLRAKYVRNAENIGADANFVQCFTLATGKYLWILGDDDLLTPNAVSQLMALLQQGEDTVDFDLVYLASFPFSGEYRPVEEKLLKDKLGRFAEVVTDGEYFLNKVNGLIALISTNIMNRNRLLETGFPPIEELNKTSLLQLGWYFPLLHAQCRVLYVWERLVLYRSYNSGGWGIAEVFGRNLNRLSRRYFAAEPKLAHALMNGVIQHWFCDSIMSNRLGEHPAMFQEDWITVIKPGFKGNWRFWIFIYPVARAPLWLARPIHGILSRYNRLLRIANAVFRHIFYRGQLVRP